MTTWRERALPVGPILLAVAATCAVLLALPGQTIATRYLNDLFLILDGAYRVASGQAPSRDFHTILGPLAYYVPALGYGLSGSLGGAMPTAMALITLLMSLPAAHVLGTRLQPVIAIPFGLFLLLIVAVPINLGESITALSFAKFYNRIGWAALAILLVMYLRPERSQARQTMLDTATAAALTLAMIYTKFTYGLVALAFLLFMLTDTRQRRWAAAALGLTIAAGLVTEAVWQSSRAYLNDLQLALAVGGRMRGTWGQITDHILANMTDYVLVGLFAGLALYRTRSLRDALFYVFCAVTGFLIINQNFQFWGIITLHAAAAVAAESILRHEDSVSADETERRWSIAAGAKLVFLALVLPTVIHCAAALGLHTAAASVQAGQAVELPNLEKVRFANLWSWNDYDTGALYLTTLREGQEVLSRLEPKPDSVVVLDLANPFSMTLKTPPPKGDMPWLQWDRTLGAAAFIPPETLLANAQTIMEPRQQDSIGSPAAPNALSNLYGPYIAAHFDLVRETEYWRVHRRRPPRQPEAALRAADGS